MTAKKRTSQRKRRPETKTRKSGRPTKAGPEITGDFWTRVPLPRRHLFSAIVLTVIAVAFYSSVNFGGKRLAGSDTVQGQGMMKSIVDYRAETGDEALWATNLFSGMPGYLISYKKAVPQVDTLFVWLRRLAWPTFQFILLLLGAYAVTFYVTRNDLASLLAACAFGLTTSLPVILSVGHATKFLALSWLPWVVLSLLYLRRNPGVLAALLFAAALAVELRANHPQITYYLMFLLGIWWLVELVSAIRGGTVGKFALATGYMIAAGIVAALTVAQPYLATYEYKSFSIRGAVADTGTGGLDWGYAMRWSHSPGELLTFLASDIFGGGGATYWGPKPGTSGPHYLGGIVVALAILALWIARTRVTIALAISAAVTMLFSLGDNGRLLNRFMFDHFPMFNAFRAPEMWLHITEFCIAALAAIGLARFVSKEKGFDRRAAARRAMIVIVSVLAFLALLSIGRSAAFDFERPLERELATRQLAAREGIPPDDPRVVSSVERYIQNQTEVRAEMFGQSTGRSIAFLIVALVFVFLFYKRRIPPYALQLALIACVVVDLWGVGQRYFPESDLVDRDVTELLPTYGYDTYIVNQVEQAGGPGHFRTLSLESDPGTNARPSYHYESVGGYHAAKLRIYQDFLEDVLIDRSTGLPGANALDLTGTRFVVSPSPLPGMQVVFQDPQTRMLVLERPDYRARTVLVGEVEVVDSDQAMLERIAEQSFDPARAAVLLEQPDFDVVPADTAGSEGTASLLVYGPRRIEWEVETDAPRLMVTSEVFYPKGWTATVNGMPVDIERVNYLFRGLPVPAGQSEVVMTFDPKSHSLGVLISATSTAFVYGLLVVFGLAAFIRRRRRKSNAG